MEKCYLTYEEAKERAGEVYMYEDGVYVYRVEDKRTQCRVIDGYVWEKKNKLLNK